MHLVHPPFRARQDARIGIRVGTLLLARLILCPEIEIDRCRDEEQVREALGRDFRIAGSYLRKVARGLGILFGERKHHPSRYIPPLGIIAQSNLMEGFAIRYDLPAQ